MEIDLFIMNMGGANLFLGIQWIKTVSSVLYNYTDMNIEFNWQGQRVKWVGEKLISEGTLSQHEMKFWAATSVGVFFCRFEYVEELEPNMVNPTFEPDSVRVDLQNILRDFEDVFVNQHAYHHIELNSTTLL